MPLSLEKKAAMAATRKQIATDTLAATKAEALTARYKNFVNENVRWTSRRRLGATTPGRAERDMSTSDRRRAMAMARQRVEESPLIYGIHSARLDLIVGQGYRLVMRSGDAAWDRVVERWWNKQKDRLDVRGVRSWARLLRTLQARRDVDGDVGAVLIGGPYAEDSKVQVIEADRIRGARPGMTDDDGVELDDLGRYTRFFVGPRDPDSKAEPVSYSAADFIFYLNDGSERAERLRGVSAYLQVLALHGDYRDILDGIVQKVKNESFIGLKFWMESGGDGNLFGDSQGEAASDDGLARQHVDMVAGMNLQLLDGERAEVLESSNPSSQLSDFEKKLVSRIAFPVGLTYELVTGDYSQVNYSSSKAMLEGCRRRIKAEQDELEQVAQRIFQWRLSRAVKYGELTPPAGLATWWEHDWGRPGFPSFDPMKDAQALSMNLTNGVTSRRRWLADMGQGDDFDDIVGDLADERQKMLAAGLTTDVATFGKGGLSSEPDALQPDQQHDDEKPGGPPNDQ